MTGSSTLMLDKTLGLVHLMIQEFLLDPCCVLVLVQGLPDGSEDEESARNARDVGSIPGLGRSPGGGNGNPFQYSCLENLTEEPGGLKELDTTDRLSMHVTIKDPSYLN